MPTKVKLLETTKSTITCQRNDKVISEVEDNALSGCVIPLSEIHGFSSFALKHSTYIYTIKYNRYYIL